jgi:hypothetical protein
MTRSTRAPLRIAALVGVAAVFTASAYAPHAQQSAQQAAPAAPAARQRPKPVMDPKRAEELYVSKDPQDQSLGTDFKRDVEQKAATDKRYADASRGVMDFSKVTFRSSVGDMDIPA